MSNNHPTLHPTPTHTPAPVTPPISNSQFPIPLLLPLLLLLLPRPLAACNPEFPNGTLGKTDAEMLGAPVADFRAELAHIAPAADPGVKAIPPKDFSPTWMDGSLLADQTEAAEAADLRAALPAGPASERLVAALQTWRAALRKAPDKAGSLPAGLPEEFALYERGAQLYHAKDLAGARAQWQKILALPEQARHYRTAWAAYMIARTYSDADPATAIQWFGQVRTLAKAGFGDSLGLAAVSLGWEARAQWQLKNADAAIELFLEEFHAGDEMAPWSLRDVAAELLSGDEKRLASAAQNPAARQLVTAYLAAQGGPDYSTRPNDIAKKARHWLEVVSLAAPKDLRGADRLAWVAYQNDDAAGADRWLKLGGNLGENTPLGQWIRAKLWLRAGQIDQAAGCLANAAAAFPQNEEWNDVAEGYWGDLPWKPAAHAAGELAALKLGRGQFADALDLLYRNNFWDNAAYIAECVLTPDELKAYVDRNFPRHDPGKYVFQNETDPGAKDKRVDHGIRYLLARRLTRLGRWQEARPYYPADMQPVLDQYIVAIRDGHDDAKTPVQKAGALWAAAKIARYQGLELLGTELAPDGAVEDGQFDMGTRGELRPLKPEEAAQRTLTPQTADEKQRLTLPPEAVPDKRWHYRYIACDHAWAAALLLPDDTEDLAKLLVEAGSWVSARDPKAADRFYKALVTRCSQTDLGKQAAQLKWLPPFKAK